jgi:imidazole glycerol-phosphate synthase subunit HisH
MRIGLIDYGAGNFTSVIKALSYCDADVRIVPSSVSLRAVQAIVIPGVGHFGRTSSLDRAWRRSIRSRIASGVPVLGICLGMHFLFEGSDEAPDVGGLGIFPNRCAKLRGNVKVPHVGWNALDSTGRPSRLLHEIPSGAFAYFAHSYVVPDAVDAVATTTHGRPFASVVERDRVFGTQFHPEKSGAIGLKVLANFLTVAREAAC